jgi:hypothetical protein
MSLTKRSQSYYFSSDPSLGARNVSADGSSFSVQLDNPIGVPREAVEAEISCTSASIWWTIFNLSADLGNNKLYLYSEWSDGINPPPAGSPNWTITIPDGLYSVSGLNSAMAREIANLGLPGNLISLGGDESTQKTTLSFSGAGYRTYIDFTPVDTFRLILGYEARQAPVFANQSTDGFTELSDNVARFNTIDAFLIETDLISDGIPTNNISSGNIARVGINVSPGSLITHQPFNPDVVSARELIGQTKNAFNFRLLDQSYNRVNTNTEIWSFVVKLDYYIPEHLSVASGHGAGTYR